MDKVRRLLRLRGVGENSAWLYGMEFFGWRAFHNRREVGGLAGLVTTPFDSGAYPARRRFGNRLPPISLSPRVVFPHTSGGGRSALGRLPHGVFWEYNIPQPYHVADHLVFDTRLKFQKENRPRPA